MSTTRFFAGAIVGIVAGLLLAPQKGEDLREEIADSAEKLKNKLYRIAGNTSTELSDLRKMLEVEVNGMSDDVRRRILTILNEAEDGAENIRENLASELR